MANATERIVILGGRGYLGQYFLRHYPGASVPGVDITDRQKVAEMLDAERPTVVINCAGKTGRPNVDWCESHKLETVKANVTGSLIVMEECLDRQVFLCHISSGCIYAGDNDGKGFSEEDAPNFAGSFYSRTKAWSDQIMRDFPVLTVRLRMPFDGTTGDRNLIMKIRKYTRVLNEPNSLTHLPEFIQATTALISRRTTGIFNIVNEGTISPLDIMRLYREIINPEQKFEELTKDQIGEVARAGRSNCFLDSSKLRAAGLGLRPVREAVISALSDLKKVLR